MVCLAAILVKQEATMSGNAKNRWKLVAIVSGLLGIFERLVSWISGSILDDTLRAADNIRKWWHAADNMFTAICALGVIVGIVCWVVEAKPWRRTVAKVPASGPMPTGTRPPLPDPSPGGGQPMYCTLCDAKGKLEGASEECALCAGYGYIYTYRSDQPPCPACDETGKAKLFGQHATRACFKCAGDGRLPKQYPEDRPPTNKNTFRDEEARYERLQRFRNRSPLAELFSTVWPFGLTSLVCLLLCAGIIVWYVFFSGEVVIAWRNGHLIIDWAK